MNQQYIQCMDNLGNPFLSPDMNGLEISENEAYKGKATICSPTVEVESVIGSIVEAEDDGDEEEYNDDDEAFEKQIENINIIPEVNKNKNDNINKNNNDDNKENLIYNNNNNNSNTNSFSSNNSNIANQFLRSNKHSDKNLKGSAIASVTSFRKYSLPTSNSSKYSSDEGKYLQRSKSNNKSTPLESTTPLSFNNNTNSLSKNNNTSESNSNSSKSHRKNKKYERILAIHDYKARDNREMSLEKGDVIIVKQKKGTWIYGVKESNIFKLDLITNHQIKFDHREHGWVPSTYVKSYNNNLS